MQKIFSLNRELKEFVLDHGIVEAEVKSDYMETVVTNLNDDLKETIAIIKDEDDKRALYSLDN